MSDHAETDNKALSVSQQILLSLESEVILQLRLGWLSWVQVDGYLVCLIFSFHWELFFSLCLGLLRLSRRRWPQSLLLVKSLHESIFDLDVVVTPLLIDEEAFVRQDLNYNVFLL